MRKSRVQFALLNNSSRTLENHGWTIYFNQMADVVIPESLPPEIVVENIVGEYFQLYPTENFLPLSPGNSVSFLYEVGGLILRKSDAPAGLYIVFDDGSGPEIISDYHAKPISQASLGDFKTPSPESRYHENGSLTKLSLDQVPRILPRPFKINPGTGALSFSEPITVSFQPALEAEAQYLSEFLKTVYSNDVQIRAGGEPGPDVIQLKLQNIAVNNTTSEAYKLSVTDNGVEIIGSDAAGVFYGIQSFIALLPTDVLQEPQPALSLDFVSIEDAPRFPYRGLHMDVARNFHSKETAKKFLDLMSFYKLNKFHMHLSDDEGWRLEIDGLPELTAVGARRGHTTDEMQNLYPAYGSGPFSDPAVSYGTGYYSRDDFIEILRYATARHIEVIPEIDVPGHARAAIKSMNARYEKYMAQGEPEKARQFLLHDFEDQSEYTSAQNYHDNVICVCLESCYNFIERVVADIVAMYQAAGAPLTAIHCGGDEVPQGAWEKSPVCEAFLKEYPDVSGVDGLHIYFLRRFVEILARHDIKAAGWEEIALRKEPKGTSEIMTPNPEFLENEFQTYVWNAVWGWGREDLAYRLANFGYPVIMCNSSSLYFDLAYNRDPGETGLDWSGYVDTRKPFELTPLDIIKTATTDIHGNPLDVATLVREKTRLSDEGKQNFLGIQAQLWSETLRGPEFLEYMAFPKLLGLAERAWAATPGWVMIEDRAARFEALEDDWNVFVNMVGQRELPRLEYLHGGVNYRIPLPGAIIENGQLKANVRFPGLTIRYSTDGSEPDLNSLEYSGPVSVNGQIRLKAFSQTGRSSR
ncbi:MAG: carbohydate-binding domain-containing protein, partial [Fidelibacterota bacterium]